MAIWDLRGNYLIALARKYGWTRGAELGVWYGKTLFAMLAALPDLTMIGVDNWAPYPHHAHHKDQAANREEVMRNAAMCPRAVIIEKDMTEAARDVPDASLDFIFIDGDHSYEGCRQDIVTWLPKIKPDGWITGHDFLFPGVHEAVTELLMPVNCPTNISDETWARPVHIPRSATTVCCLKWGTKYGPEYVNILDAMVRRNVQLEPYDFVCFTDDARGINPWIRTAPLPYDGPEWWGKMGLYRPEVPGIRTERLLFLDLDVVITGSLDPLLRHDADFALAKDWPTGSWPNHERDRHGNTSVILLRVGAAAWIWDRYRAEGHPHHEKSGDQEWINEKFFGVPELLPEHYVKSYKLHALQGNTAPDCMVTLFHGLPKPPDCGGWVKEYWKDDRIANA